MYQPGLNPRFRWLPLILRLSKVHLTQLLASEQGHLQAPLTGRCTLEVPRVQCWGVALARMLIPILKIGTWTLTDMRVVCSHLFMCCRMPTFPVRTRFVFRVRGGFLLLRCLRQNLLSMSNRLMKMSALQGSSSGQRKDAMLLTQVSNSDELCCTFFFFTRPHNI